MEITIKTPTVQGTKQTLAKLKPSNLRTAREESRNARLKEQLKETRQTVDELRNENKALEKQNRSLDGTINGLLRVVETEHAKE